MYTLCASGKILRIPRWIIRNSKGKGEVSKQCLGGLGRGGGGLTKKPTMEGVWISWTTTVLSLTKEHRRSSMCDTRGWTVLQGCGQDIFHVDRLILGKEVMKLWQSFSMKAGCTLSYLCYCLFCDWYIISLKVKQQFQNFKDWKKHYSVDIY